MKKKISIVISILAIAILSVSCNQQTDNGTLQVSTMSMATVEGADTGIGTVTSMFIKYQNQSVLNVVIAPVSANANTVYKVEFYEKGELRDSASIAWSQPEINVSTPKTVLFALKQDEAQPYYQASLADPNWWTNTFSVNLVMSQ